MISLGMLGLNTIWGAIKMDYQRMKEAIQRMMEANYPDFIQALISIETGVEDRDYLKESYYHYINDDGSKLLSNDLANYKGEF